MVKTFRLDEFGYKVEIGKVALQANGAAWLERGGTVVLATVVAAPSKEFPGFFPLTIDYRENFSAGGKIPGGYYKREGRPSDREVLTSRLIDRAVRPLFPYSFFDQVQILATAYSVDKKHTPNVMSLVASSIALAVSGIPVVSPVAAVEVCRIDGKWVIDPVYEEAQKADVRLVIAGTEEGINMVEGSANELSDKEMVDAFFFGHDAIKKIVAWQKSIQRELGVTVKEVEDAYGWKSWEERANNYLTNELVKEAFIADKTARNQYLKTIKDNFIAQHALDIEAVAIPTSFVEYVYEQALQLKITELIIAQKKRVDGRSFNQVRPISVEVGNLPFVHGSALFTRGRTQALVSVTLGGGDDEQQVESVMESTVHSERFMLHYNFPPFSVGEVRFMRGPGRREIGHGHLAASAIRRMLPDKETFAYTIRVVADMLESDGSTSMATTCGATMALMQAGVPMKKMVGGIAMGLLRSASGESQVLSDISGFEDAFGLMDFKVTGTDDGITAIQMDIKYKGGLTREIFISALADARAGYTHILNEMKKVMSKPSPTLSDLVPKLITLKVDTDKIGAIIGSGGKTIREIIEKTGTSIDIEPDGLVKILAPVGAKLDEAIAFVKTLGGQIEPGMKYVGTIKRQAEFGLFVEVAPGLDGLVHVSAIPREKQRTFAQEYKVGDTVSVEVVDYDPSTGRIRLRLI